MHAPTSSPTTLVGRDRELVLLRTCLAAALDGPGTLVLLSGEAGIGKTRLAEALCLEAREQAALILVGRCYDLIETPPYGPWVELFKDYPSTAAALPPVPPAFAQRGTVGAVASQAELFQQVEDFLRESTKEHPLVLLLDDLHWSDPASLDLLRFVARSVSSLPLLLLVTYRAGELTRRHPLYQLLPLLVRETSATRITLRPLEKGDTRTLVRGRFALPAAAADRLIAYLDERGEGNPFFIGELLRTLEEERVVWQGDDGWMLGDLAGAQVPPLLRQVIDARLARLGDEAQALLAMAAVIGQDVPFALWAAVVERDAAMLLEMVEQATAAQLVDTTADGTGFRFVHALIREALYEGIIPLRRRLLHGQVGEVLAALPDADPGAVAFHFQQAGDRRAVAWLVAAGERAQGSFAWLTAADRYEAALALLSEGGPEAGERGWLLYRISRMRRWESAERSIAYLSEGLRVAERVGDRALAALVRFTRGIVRFNGTAEFADGVAEVIIGVAEGEALTAAERERIRPYEPAFAAYPRIGLTIPYWWIGRYRDVLAIVEGQPASLRVAEVAKEPATAVLISRRGEIAMTYMMLGRPDEAKAERRWDIAHFRATQNYQRLGQLLLQELYLAVAYETDRVELRRRLAAECEDALGRARAIGGGYTVRNGSLPVLVLEGRWAEARALLDRMHHDEGRWAYLVWPGLLTWLGLLARAQGEREQAWRLVDEALPEGVTSEPGFGYFWARDAQQLAAALCLDANDLPQARAWLEASGRWLEWSGAVLGQSEVQALWAQYHRASGHRDQAYKHAHQALVHATAPRQPLALLAAHRLLGELDTDAGRFGNGAAHLNAAMQLADTCVAAYERALTLLARAALLAATGDQTGATALLDEVRVICTPLGAKPALARVDTLVAQLAPSPSSPQAYPANLTAREVEVLRLVAAGQTSRVIAEHLFLSAVTVNNHIAHILTKTRTANRAEAAAFAQRHGLI